MKYEYTSESRYNISHGIKKTISKWANIAKHRSKGELKHAKLILIEERTIKYEINNK